MQLQLSDFTVNHHHVKIELNKQITASWLLEYDTLQLFDGHFCLKPQICVHHVAGLGLTCGQEVLSFKPQTC